MKGSIIFYRSSPVALTRERCTSIRRSGTCCQVKVSDVCQVQGHFVCSLTSRSSKVSVSLFRHFVQTREAEMAVSGGVEKGGLLLCWKGKTPLLSVSAVVSQAARGYQKPGCVERRLIGIATGEIKELVGRRGRVTSAGPRRQKTTAAVEMKAVQLSLSVFQRPNPIPNVTRARGGRPADVFFVLNAVKHMSSATNSHNYLQESWTRPGLVQSAPTDHHPNHPPPTSVIKAYNHTPPYASNHGTRIHPFSVEAAQAVPGKPRRRSPKFLFFRCFFSPPSSVFVSMSKHKRVAQAEFLSSGSPQGLSSPMLVVIFLSLSSLFTSAFSFFLNYLKCYLSNK